MVIHYKLADEQATVDFGRALGGRLAKGSTVFLSGTLGAGKTTFCRGVLAAHGYSGAVKSPTYTLVEPYTLGETSINHFDLYRLADPEELEYIGIREYFDSQAICIIEWPERGEGFLQAPAIEVEFSVLASGRLATLDVHDNELANRLKEITSFSI